MNKTTYENRSLEDLRSSYRAVTKKIETMQCEAAEIVGIIPLPEHKKFWVSTEINWDDTRLDHMRDEYLKLLDTAYELHHVVEKLHATQTNTLEQYQIYQEIDEFLSANFNTFDEEIAFFKKNNLVRGLSSLREKVLENPAYLEEVVL